MRYTKKVKDDLYNIPSHIFEAFKKLGALEDIEEEIGIDLVTFMTVITKGAYFKGREDRDGWKPGFRFEDKVFLLDGAYMGTKAPPTNFYFKDYGKTWALTKEELEEEE